MSHHLDRTLLLLGACSATACLPEALAPYWLADAERLTNEDVSTIELSLSRVDDGPDGEQRYTAHIEYVDTNDAAWGQLTWCRLGCNREEPYPVQIFLEGSTESVMTAWEGEVTYGSPDLQGDMQADDLTVSWVLHTNLYQHLVPFEATFEPVP